MFDKYPGDVQELHTYNGDVFSVYETVEMSRPYGQSANYDDHSSELHRLFSGLCSGIHIDIDEIVNPDGSDVVDYETQERIFERFVDNCYIELRIEYCS